MAPPMGVCVFNLEWLNDSRWSSWISTVPNDIHKARCTVCSKNFNLSNMGQRALDSHAKGIAHSSKIQFKQNLKQPKIMQLLSTRTSQVESLSQLPTAHVDSLLVPDIEQNINIDPSNSVKSTEGSMIIEKHTNPYQFQNAASRAEILWALNLVASHNSFRSCDNIAALFQTMFSDSKIARNFTMKKDKATYTIVYGLAPYFADKLKTACSITDFFVVCFDEALNKISQHGQMDVLVRMWNNETNRVNTRYLTSIFLGHATAEDLLKGIKSVFPGQEIKKILQLSMDGPNVNWKLHELVNHEMVDEPNDPVLVEMGSCGLHSVHGAFRTGSKGTGWELEGFLRSLYNLFKDSPARRADFQHYSGSSLFPKKFCSTRWVESATVAERATLVLPNVKKYISEIVKAKKEPTSTSYKVVKKEMENPLLKARLGFFISVASQLEPFLVKFQTDKPVAPFLYDEIVFAVKALMSRIVKSNILATAKTPAAIARINMNDKENLLHYKDVDIGFAAKTALKENKEKVSEIVKVKFLGDCRDFIKNVVNKLQERCPIRYRLVKGISCLVPSSIVNKPNVCRERLTLALEVFVETHRMSAVTADKVKQNFQEFIITDRVIDEMKSFNPSKDRLDSLYSNLLKDNMEFLHLFVFVKMCLVLSHGNASVESGFSINKEMLVENLHEESLTAMRVVYDSIHYAGGVSNIDITPSLLQYVRQSSAKRKEALNERKQKEKCAEEATTSRKRQAREVAELQKKKQKLEKDMKEQLSQLDLQIESTMKRY